MESAYADLSFAPYIAYDPIREHYPNAIDSRVLIEKFLRYAVTRYGLKPTDIMHADSICSDDINNIQYPPSDDPMLGPFGMGGLDGYPFTGVTGMGAFAHHVPDEGALFIYYAPHIGISQKGDVGQILRPGQSHLSTCCGAAKGAIDRLSQTPPGCNINDDDFQFNTIWRIFKPQASRILGARYPIIEATQVMYEANRNAILNLARKNHLAGNFKCQYVFFVGSILINSDGKRESFVDVRNIERLTVASGAIDDIKNEVMASMGL